MAGDCGPVKPGGGELMKKIMTKSRLNGLFDQVNQILQSSAAMKLFGIVSLFIATTATVVAQTNAPETRKLSLAECIEISLEHNFDVQIVRFNPQIARYTLAGSYGAYDPSLSLSGQHENSTQPGGVDTQGRIFAGSEAQINSFAAGLNGVLPWGMNYNLGASASDQWGTKPGVAINPNNPTGFTTNTFLDGGGNTVTLISTNFGTVQTRIPYENTSAQAAALTLSQPLLKNFWIDPTRYQIYVNKSNIKITQEDFRAQVMTTMTSVEAAYFNLISAQDFVRVQEQALALAEQLLAENKKKVEVGAMAPLDEKQAEAQAASSRADLLAAQASLDTARRVLKNLLSDNYAKDWADVVVAPTDLLLALPQHFDLQESWRMGLAKSPSLTSKRINLNVAKYNIRLQRNQLFPQLDVIGSYGYNGSGQEFSDAFGQIGNQSNPFWTIGGQLSIPLGQSSARNNLKSAKAGQAQLALQLKQAEQTLLITIENDIGTAKADFEQVDATHQARLYAELALDAEQKKLENGKSTNFEVLSLQSNLTTARANEIKALANYNVALAQLAFDEGSTLERRNVSLNLVTLVAQPINGK
jgi:outer membrane protein